MSTADQKMNNSMATERSHLVSRGMEAAMVKIKAIFNINNLRGLTSFIGIGEPKAFNLPSKEEVVRRARYNLWFFATNYVAVVLILAFLTILMNPLFLIVLIFIGAGWFYVARMSEDPIFIMGHAVSAHHRTLGMSALSLGLVLLFGGSVLFTISCASGVCICAHAVLRNSAIPEEDEYGFLAEPQYTDSKV